MRGGRITSGKRQLDRGQQRGSNVAQLSQTEVPSTNMANTDSLLELCELSSVPSTQNAGHALSPVDPAPTPVDPTPIASPAISGSSSRSTHVPRGPARGMPTPNNPEDRKKIKVQSKSFIGHEASAAISATIKQFFLGPWVSWKDIPPQTRELLWEHFCAKFCWDEPDFNVRATWEKISAHRLSDILSECRKNALKRVSTTNIIATRDSGPDWISPEHWRSLVDTWSSEQWKKKSAAAARNRATKTNDSISKHSVGSVSFAMHKDRLSVKLGRLATHIEVFEATHEKKGTSGTWIDRKSEKVYESYNQAITQMYGNNLSSQPGFDATAWVQATGESTKIELTGLLQICLGMKPLAYLKHHLVQWGMRTLHGRDMGRLRLVSFVLILTDDWSNKSKRWNSGWRKSWSSG